MSICRWGRLTVAIGFVAAAAGCADDSSGASSLVADTGSAADTQDAGPGDTGSATQDTTPADTGPAVDTTPPRDTAPPPPRSLAFEGGDCDGATTCAWTVEPKAALPVAVRYTEADGTPIEGALIGFAVDSDPLQAKLDSVYVYTDAAGRAEASLTTFSGATDAVTLTVHADGDEDAGELSGAIEFTIELFPPLRLGVDYLGERQVQEFEVLMWLQGADGAPGCEAVHPDSGGFIPAPELSAGLLGLIDEREYDFLPGLTEGTSQRWTVVAFGPGVGSPVALGCRDDVDVTFGETADVVVVAEDLPYLWENQYVVHTRANLYDGLSGSAGDIVGVVVSLFSTPGETAVLAACQNSSGFLDTVCAFLVGGGGLTPYGVAVADAGTSVFFDLMAATLGDDVTFTGQSLALILTDVRFNSTITLAGEPVDAGDGTGDRIFAPGAATEVWDTVSYYWRAGLGCDVNDEQCGLRTLKLVDVYGAYLQADLDARIDADDGLTIARHTIDDFDYGVLINHLVEQQVLPLAFGDGTGANGLPRIDTYDEVISQMFGDDLCILYDDCCEIFVQKPAVIDLGLPELITFPACELAIDAASSWIRDRMATLAGPLTIGTEDGQPCPAVEVNLDRQIDGLGTVTQRCAWDMSFDLGSSTLDPDGSFYGVRK